jgi:endonuclease G
MDDALTGNLSTDRKTGSYSARVRNVGLVHMNFNKTGGAGTVSIQHAVFSTDGSSTWQLWSSTNNGSSWTQVGSSIHQFDHSANGDLYRQQRECDSF